MTSSHTKSKIVVWAHPRSLLRFPASSVLPRMSPFPVMDTSTGSFTDCPSADQIAQTYESSMSIPGSQGTHCSPHFMRVRLCRLDGRLQSCLTRASIAVGTAIIAQNSVSMRVLHLFTPLICLAISQLFLSLALRASVKEGFDLALLSSHTKIFDLVWDVPRVS